MTLARMNLALFAGGGPVPAPTTTTPRTKDAR